MGKRNRIDDGPGRITPEAQTVVEPVIDLDAGTPGGAPAHVDIVIDVSVPVPSIVGERFSIDETHDAEVYGPNDPITTDIIELEVQQLMALGDREDESREWLNDRTACAWIALFEREAKRSAQNVLGILRVTGPIASDRVLRDLAYLRGTGVEEVESQIRDALGVDDIRPFVDFTTLDITRAGASSLRDQAHNFGRLLTILTVACAKLVLRDEARFALALVHPHLWKAAARIGVAYEDPGFGVMDYKLSAKNTTPMPTQLIAQNMVDTIEIIRSGRRPFMSELGRCMERNGIDLGLLYDKAQASLGRVRA
jgi:hypothetical protein